jgi:hypothetical protein
LPLSLIVTAIINNRREDFPCFSACSALGVARTVKRPFAVTQRVIGRGILAGQYLGVSGNAAAGVGLGAKGLIGGSRRTTMLQPLSLSGQVGANLAAGVAGLTLRHVR